MRPRHFLILVALLMASCQTPVDVAPTLSGDRRWTFPLTGVDTVILRARRAKTAHISTARMGAEISIYAKPAGGAEGYHPSNPSWRQTAPANWGLGFTGRRYGNKLVISSHNEISFIHHDYFLDDIHIAKPPNLTVRLKERVMGSDDGNGAPDLRP